MALWARVSSMVRATIRGCGVKAVFNTNYALPNNTTSALADPRPPGSFGYHPETIWLLKHIGKHVQVTPSHKFMEESKDHELDDDDIPLWRGYAKSQNKEVYQVHVDLGTEDAESVFKDVLEKAGCTSGFIRHYGHNSFFAMLDEKQRAKLQDVKGVSDVFFPSFIEQCS